MMRYAMGAAVIGALLVTPHASAADSFEATGERMTHFYLTPTRDEFDAIQNGMKANLRQFKAQEKENGTALMAAVFLARVSHKYHFPLLDIGHLDDTARSIATGDGSKIANYVNDDSQIDPGKLDIWWVSYFATGETNYLDNILAQVADLKSQSGVSHILVAGAANWSLASNCEQHLEVLEYVRSVIARTPPPPNADALREVLTHVGKHDGQQPAAPGSGHHVRG